jgi:hypothetical protein
LSTPFTFADENGNQVEVKVENFLDIGKLGYKYEKLESITTNCPNISPLFEAGAVQSVHAIAPEGGIKLGAGPIQVTLRPPAVTESTSIPLTNRVKALKRGKRLYLVLKNLQANTQPGVLYNIYCDLPANAHKVGTINFFDAVGHDGHNNTSPSPNDKSVSFDITQVAKKLRATGLLKDKPVLTIAPSGQPDANAQPVIGEIQLVEQ